LIVLKIKKIKYVFKCVVNSLKMFINPSISRTISALETLVPMN